MAAFTTAFNDDETTKIKSAIKALAQRHCNLIKPAFIDIEGWRQVIVDKPYRQLALDAERTYYGMFGLDTYSADLLLEIGTISLAPDQFVDAKNVRAQFGWALSTDHRFPNPHAKERIQKFYTDANPELVENIMEAAREWVAVGMNYALLLSVFDWINDTCEKGNRRQARTLLPGLTVLARSFNPDLARKLLRPVTLREAVDPDLAPALVRANQIIMEGQLLPRETPSKGAVNMWLTTTNHLKHPLWPQNIIPLVDA